MTLELDDGQQVQFAKGLRSAKTEPQSLAQNRFRNLSNGLHFIADGG